MISTTATAATPLSLSQEEILADYRLAYRSRQASLIGRKEVLTGKAKFGIFGDGKEIPQLAMARVCQPGDVRAGYYRDQTFMLALGLITIEELFAQLYADPDPAHEPASAGRQMNGHFSTQTVDEEGHWKRLVDRPYTTADTSPTASQMPRLVGLAYASRLYRELDGLNHLGSFSNRGNEIAFGTIGNASCAEGVFFEAINAAGVLGAPLVMSIWDDDYGISVHNEHQIVKEDLSAVLSGFCRRPGESNGYDLYTVKGWDYLALCEAYGQATQVARREHVPALIHVIELTQPQGHSTSGSHQRYKSAERLEWERQHDCLVKMRQWILDEGFVSAAALDELERSDLEDVKAAQRQAWKAFMEPIHHELGTLLGLVDAVAQESRHRESIEHIATAVGRIPNPVRRNMATTAWEVLYTVRDEELPSKRALITWYREQDRTGRERYTSHLYSESPERAVDVPETPADFDEEAPKINGSEVLNRFFDAAFARIPELIAFGEDVGHLGDVNQGMSGLQEKYGKLRVSDTGIRECTILGQAIGMAMRGLRPIAEIQYLDYLLYALQILSDDLATLRYRTRGTQKAPVIIRTRGHRLEGIWHSGSLMSGILGLTRGVYFCVPRDMTQAAGFYNTLLRSDDSGIVVEVLNGYRLKEKAPSNLDEFTIPLGIPEILRSGSDVTLVTYGACCRIALEAADKLAEVGIEIEVIDVRTLLPFDLLGSITDSLRRTHRIVFLDEDVPGGASAYMMQKVLEEQRGYHWLDAEPRTLSSTENRPAYGSDGDYWSKPNAEQIFATVYELMHEAEPERFPIFYR